MYFSWTVVSSTLIPVFFLRLMSWVWICDSISVVRTFDYIDWILSDLNFVFLWVNAGILLASGALICLILSKSSDLVFLAGILGFSFCFFQKPYVLMNLVMARIYGAESL